MNTIDSNNYKQVQQPSFLRLHSSGKWEAHKNTSWDERHKLCFGNKSGYVICHRNEHNELIAIATIIGKAFSKQQEIDANAKLIESAPLMLSFIEEVVQLEKQDEDARAARFSEIIKKAKETLWNLS